MKTIGLLSSITVFLFQIHALANSCKKAQTDLQAAYNSFSTLCSSSSPAGCQKVASSCNAALKSHSGGISSVTTHPQLNQLQKCPPLQSYALNTMTSTVASQEAQRQAELDTILRLIELKRQAEREQQERADQLRQEVREEQRYNAERISDIRREMTEAMADAKEKIAAIQANLIESNTKANQAIAQAKQEQVKADLDFLQAEYDAIEVCEQKAEDHLQKLKDKRMKLLDENRLVSSSRNKVFARDKILKDARSAVFIDCVNSNSYSRKIGLLHTRKAAMLSSTREQITGLQQQIQANIQSSEQNTFAIQQAANDRVAQGKKEIALLELYSLELKNEIENSELLASFEQNSIGPATLKLDQVNAQLKQSQDSLAKISSISPASMGRGVSSSAMLMAQKTFSDISQKEKVAANNCSSPIASMTANTSNRSPARVRSQKTRGTR